MNKFVRKLPQTRFAKYRELLKRKHAVDQDLLALVGDYGVQGIAEET